MVQLLNGVDTWKFLFPTMLISRAPFKLPILPMFELYNLNEEKIDNLEDTL